MNLFNKTIEGDEEPLLGISQGNITVTIDVPFLPFGLGLIIVTSLGIIGNILSALVLSRKIFQSSYSVLTLGLSIFDSIYLFTKLHRYGLNSLFLYFSICRGFTHYFLPIVGPYLRAISFTAHTGSTYFTIMMALDRLIAVSLPLQARKFCTQRKARILAILLTLFSIIYNIPRWFEFHTEERKGSGISLEEETYYQMTLSPLRKDASYRLYYIFWAYFFVMFIFPFVSLIYLNCSLWIGLQKVKKQTHMTQTQLRDTSFAAMLIGIVTVFFLCNIDYLILDILDFFNVPFNAFWSHLGNFLLTLNSAVNFLIYCICGKRFSEELRTFLKEVCCCKKRTRSLSETIGKDSFKTEGFGMETTIIK